MANLIHFSDTDLSDFYKEANGFRPRHYKEWWTEEELNEEYRYLGAVCEENMKEEMIREAKAYDKFNEIIQETIKNGAPDKDTAIKWLIQAENIDDSFIQDLEYFFWGYGLSYKLQTELAKKFLNKN